MRQRMRVASKIQRPFLERVILNGRGAGKLYGKTTGVGLEFPPLKHAGFRSLRTDSCRARKEESQGNEPKTMSRVVSAHVVSGALVLPEVPFRKLLNRPE